MTSQRLTVTHADLDDDRLHATTDDGRTVVLEGDTIDADHRDYGYALTVHRSQGATYDRAHVLATGGGRELAYVALRRARIGTTLHAIADDLPQLRHDLALHWHTDRAQRWLTGTPTAHAEVPSCEVHDQNALGVEMRRQSHDLTPSTTPGRHLGDDLGLGL